MFSVFAIVLFLVALATWQGVEIWHHSALMAIPRSYAQNLDGFVGRLLTCPFCLSVWVSGIFTLIGLTTVVLVKAGYPMPGLLLIAPLLVLGGSRLANLGNDGFYGQCRTPKENKLPAVNTDKDESFKRESLAFVEGVGAFTYRGEIRDDNPYNANVYRERYKAWEDGYTTAELADRITPVRELLKDGN